MTATQVPHSLRTLLPIFPIFLFLSMQIEIFVISSTKFLFLLRSCIAHSKKGVHPQWHFEPRPHRYYCHRTKWTGETVTLDSSLTRHYLDFCKFLTVFSANDSSHLLNYSFTLLFIFFIFIWRSDGSQSHFLTPRDPRAIWKLIYCSWESSPCIKTEGKGPHSAKYSTPWCHTWPQRF